MKKIIFSLMIVGMIFSLPSYAQFNKIKEGANKIGIGKNKDKDKDKDEETVGGETEDATETETVTETAAAPTMKDGVGYFYNTYSSDDFVTSANVGDELYVRMNFGKTMNEFHPEFGLEVSHYSYGWVNIYINGVLVKEIGELSFSSNYSKVWTYIDLPLLVRPEFLEEIQEDQSAIETGQDVWVFQQLFNEQSVSNQYTIAAIQNMKDGKNTLKIEFGVANKGDEKMAGVISTAEIEITSDKEGMKQLYKSGPKYLRPLDENEVGKWNYSSTNYTAASGDLTATLELPFTPKYYNMKWCQSMSCDYDHGDLLFAAFIDGEILTSWGTTFNSDTYDAVKSFDMVVIPAADKGIYEDLSALNKSDLFEDNNPLVYAMFDWIYSGRMNVGEHKLTIKCYSPESIPLGTTFVNNTEYHKQWPSIAETTMDFNLTADGLNKLVSTSSAKKLSHAGGEWASVDSHLKATLASGMPEIEIIDVACYSEWKVTLDYYGTPMYRECKADIIYNNTKEYGCRLLRANKIKEDYNGSGYGKPYCSEVLNTYFFSGSFLLYHMHLPMPLSRVK